MCPASGLAIGSDGAFYGTALGGLTPPTTGGTIYRITADGSHNTLWSRNSFDGDPRFPQAAPSRGPDGRLYVPVGALAAVMRIEADLTVTHFADVPNASQHEDGQWMTGPLLLANDGNFYATTSTNPGSVLRLSSDGTFAPVHRFPYESATPRANRRSGLIQGADGRLYGASQRGGRLDAGVVYFHRLFGSHLGATRI